MIEIYKVKYEDVKLESSELEKFMGYPAGETPDMFKDIIKEVLSDLKNFVDPTGGYSVKDASFIDNHEIKIDELN